MVMWVAVALHNHNLANALEHATLALFLVYHLALDLLGRLNGTSQAYFLAILIVAASSDDKINLSIKHACCACSMVHANKGLPSNGLMFLPLSRLDPALAGIIAKILLPPNI